MKLEKIAEAYEDTSAQASQLLRQLAFAGVAVIWILRVGDKTGGIQYSAELFLPLSYLVIALAFDVMQYLLKTVTLWGVNTYFWLKYRDNDKDVSFSGWWNVLPSLCFIGKALFIVIAYANLLRFMYSALHPK